MVISLGLERFFYGEPDDARAAPLRALVEQGLTTRVRDVTTRDPKALDGARVREAFRQDDGQVVVRWLDDDEAQPLLADLKAVYAKHDTFASFSWNETDRLGIEMPSLAIVNDGERRAALRARVELPGLDGRVTVGDLSSCWLGSRRHRQVTIARAYLELARKHRLIVHTA